MPLTDYLLTEASFTGNEIEGLDDQPTLTAEELKDKFDAASKNVIMPAHNGVINTLAAADIDYLRTGWIPFNATGTFHSIDDPTGTFKIAGDVRNSFWTRLKIRLVNNGNTIYGKVNTTPTYDGTYTYISFMHEMKLVGGTNMYTRNTAKTPIASGDVTNIFTSTHRSPQNFPPSNNWDILFFHTADLDGGAQTGPSWKQLHALTFIDVPTGPFRLSYSAILEPYAASQLTMAVRATLAIGSNNSETNHEYTTMNLGYSTYATNFLPVNLLPKYAEFPAKSRVYFNVQTDITVSQYFARGGIVGAPTTIRAAFDD